MRSVPWNWLAILLVVLLISSLPAEFTYPPRQFLDIEARLRVEVTDQTTERGRGEATFTLTVTGPDTLEVEEPHLDDAAAAWKEERAPSTRQVHGKRATWRQVIRLKQSKNGIETLPDVSLRFRASPDAKWQETQWVDILKHIRDLQEPPPAADERSSWLRRGWFLLVLAAVALVVLIFWLRTRWRLRGEAPLAPDQWALREIERIEKTLMPPQSEAETYHTRMSQIVRRYLAERFGLHTLQQTTVEFLEALHAVPQATAEQQALLSEWFQRCDLAKFARAGTSVEECQYTTELARELVRQLSQSGQ